MIEIGKKYRLKKLKGWFEKDSEEFIETKEYKNIDYYQETINKITFIN